MTIQLDTRLPGRPFGDRTDRWVVDIGDLELECGQVLPDVQVAFQSWGRLNARRDNAVLVLHALTGDSHLVGPIGPDQPTPGWWDGIVGPGRPHDPAEQFVLVPNVLGGCRGTTGPSSTAPDGRPWGSRFPPLTVRDQVAAERALADVLGIEAFAAVVGGSMGGMRVLEWAVGTPERVRRAVPIATTAAASAEQIAWCATQTAAVRSDPAWAGGDYAPGPGPLAGLAVARQIAQVTYRSEAELAQRFGRAPQGTEDPLTGGRFAVQSYLQYHGDKLVHRFDANSYLVLTDAMNRHDIGRGLGGVAAALDRITAVTTVAVVDSDRLYLPEQGRLIATAPATARLVTIASPHGHDGFLIEAQQVAAVVRDAVRLPLP